MIEPKSLLKVAVNAAKQAGRLLMNDRRGDIATSLKKRLDIVTPSDLKAEQRIVKVIRQNFSDHNILTEETEQARSPSPYLWVIDPIDGTVNYASHLPFFAVSIAVQHRDLTLASVVHLPALGETFTAIKGQGAFLGPIRLKVAPLKISEATISVILTSHFSSVDTQKTLSVLSELMGQVRGTRVFVCEALELAYIAAGRLSGNLCVKADAYGAAAGQLLIEEAGGKVTDFKGRPFGNESKNIIASNGVIHDYLVGICKSREQR